MSGQETRSGYRGYIASRPIAGNRTPQHIQNLVNREFAKQRALPFKLSATEYAMSECFIVLNGLLSEIESYEGIILYSLFMLPKDAGQRRAIYDRALGANAVLYAAVEDFRIANAEDVERVERIWNVANILDACPRNVSAGIN